LNARLISLEIYSLILAILGGAFFFFLQRAYSIKSEEVIKKLSLVPEIENLVTEARDKNKEVDKLKRERERLEHIVEISAGRYYLTKRYRELENRLKSTYDELVLLKKEIADLNIGIDGSLTKEKIEKIEEFIRHRERGDLIVHIGKRRFAIPRELFDFYPLGGFGLITLYISKLSEVIKKMLKKEKRL
jgi:vacuolar-type H+-ATPase subunit I/STV1